MNCRTETNQQIFDSCVRSVLHHCGVPQLDQPIEGLLESIEHEEGSVDTALNIVVVAHIAHLFLEVHVPFEEAEWTDALKRLKPRIESGLKLSREVLVKSLPGSARNGGDVDRVWFAFIPREYGMEPWTELADSALLACDMFGMCFVRDAVLLQLKQQGPIDLNTLAREFGSSASRADSFVERSTAWHRFVVHDAIRAFLEKPKRLEWEEWCGLVDICAELMQSAEPTTESPMGSLDDEWTPTSELRVSPTSAEYWAWEFGRVAAMWPLVDKPNSDSHISDYLHGWPNGLAALSLLLGARVPDEELVDRCWTGAAVASTLKSESGWHSAYPDDQSASNPLFWLMRLGFLHGSRRVESSEAVLPTRSVEPPDADMFLLGTLKSRKPGW